MPQRSAFIWLPSPRGSDATGRRDEASRTTREARVLSLRHDETPNFYFMQKPLNRRKRRKWRFPFCFPEGLC
jgi:hypothetical protein